MNVASGLFIGMCLHVTQPAQRMLHVSRVQPTSARDTTTITLAAFTARVSEHHPVIRQARLGVQQAREEQRVARGAFDPVLSAALDRKTFGTVAYYDYVTAAISVPTPIGVDMKFGFERTSGVYTSPDRRTPSRGLLSAGLSIPFGQRMLTDERRTAVTVARAMRDGAVADRDGTVNRTLLAATREYARWFEAERRTVIASEGVAVAAFRLAAVRLRVTNGEAPAIDTVEAALEVARRDVQRVEAAQARLAARLAVETYLWNAAGLPDSLPSDAVPAAQHDAFAPTDSASVPALVVAALRTHPDLARAEARLDQADASRRLASQQRLPYVAADVSALNAANDGLLGSPSLDDAKIGLSFRSPVLLLRERGRANIAESRVEQGTIDRARIRRDVEVAVRTAAADVEAAARILSLQRTVVMHARALVRGERLRFDAGEGTLFLVNTRERALLDEELRLAGLEARRLVALGELAAIGGGWLQALGRIADRP